MPRKSRVVPDYPHHIIQRGHKRGVVFLGDKHYLSYLETLRAWKEALGSKMYAYSLMTNHIHLIADLRKPALLRRLAYASCLCRTIDIKE